MMNRRALLTRLAAVVGVAALPPKVAEAKASGFPPTHGTLTLRNDAPMERMPLRDYCYPCSSKAFSGLGSYPWTCGNGHTLTSGADVWSGMPRVFSEQED